MRKRWKNLLHFSFLVIMCLFMLLLFCDGSKKQNPSDKNAKMAADFTLPSIDKEPDTIRLTDLRGKAVLLNFWATWCPPCRKEIPDLVELRKKFKKSELEIIGIALPKGNTRDQLILFRENMKMNYTIVMDDGRVAQKYGVLGIPTSFLVNKDGIIVWQYTGMPQPGTFEKEVESLLGGS